MATRKKTESLIMCQGHGSEYLKCSGMQLESNFCKSNSPFNSGRVIYCKDCLNKIYEYYLSQSNSNMQTALFYTLQKVDVPFITELFVRLQEEIKKRNKSGQRLQSVVSTYIGYVNINKAKEKIWTDFSASDVDLSDIDSRLEGREVKKKELEELELKFGKQDNVEDLYFLIDLFNRYTKGVEFINPQHEDLFVDLCQDRLDMRKIKEKRYAGEETYETLDKRVTRKMQMLKLDEFESNKPKTASEQSLFEKIRLVDENNVKEVYKEPTKYFDHNQIAKYEKDMCLRPLANMLVGHRDFDINMEDIEKYDLD